MKTWGGALISIDQEKAFDRIEINYVLQVLKAMNFGDSFISWVRLLYKDISSQILVNGTLTDSFNITRSVRQGCSLSMILYVLAIEVLGDKIRKNPNIIGIRLENHQEEKIIQHADDCNCFISIKESYKEVIKEFTNFEKASGSKINKDKTEILLLGKWKNQNTNIDPKYIKKTIKIMGINYGENEQKENYDKIIAKIKDILASFENKYLSYVQKAQIINTYIYSLLYAKIRIIELTENNIREIEKSIFKLIWNNKIDAIARKTMYLKIEEGGINLPELRNIIKAMKLQKLQKAMTTNYAWNGQYITNLGYKLTEQPEFRKNKYKHSMNQNKEFKKILEIYNQYFPKKDLLNMKTLKDIKKRISDIDDIRPKIYLQKPLLNWKEIYSLQKSEKLGKNERNFIYKSINRALPFNDFYIQRGMGTNRQNVCYFCKSHLRSTDSDSHVFVNCKHLHPACGLWSVA